MELVRKNWGPGPFPFREFDERKQCGILVVMKQVMIIINIIIAQQRNVMPMVK